MVKITKKCDLLDFKGFEEITVGPKSDVQYGASFMRNKSVHLASISHVYYTRKMREAI